MREPTFTNAICKAESKQISKDFAYCEDALGRAENAIGNLPSAQPEKRTNKRTETHACDCIERQAAIDALDMAIERYDEMAEEYRKKADIERNDYMDMRDDAYEARQLAQWLNELKYLREKIEQLAIKPEQRWIPCSERLPEQYGNYLISIHGEDEPDIGTINPNDKRGWSLCDANGFHWASDKKLIVTAWMPLPEPYKERREE